MENNITISLSSAAPTSSYRTTYSPTYVQGAGVVTFNLYGVEELLDNVLHATFDFGDGTFATEAIKTRNSIDQIDTVEIFLSNKPKSVKQNVSHAYNIDSTSLITSLSATISLLYASQYVGVHIVPLSFIQDSYYANGREHKICTSVLVPLTSNNILAVTSDYEGSISFSMYNSVSTSTPPTVPSDETIHTVFATRNGSKLVTKYNKYSLIPTLSS